MLKRILIGIAAVLALAIAGVLALAMTKPDTLNVQRSASIKAPPDRIFPMINDFRNWPKWSPYEERDPAMKRTYGSTTAGKGATYAWEGNGEVGSGRMEILDAPVPSKVTIKLDFLKPFEAHNTAEFTLEPQGEMTKVTWAMRGPNLFVGKVISVFIDMDNMIGRDFQAGLAKLKAHAESST